MNLVFVYGTLLLGEKNNYLLADSEKVGDWETPPEYTLFSLGNYPALSPAGKSSVVGEVWRVDDTTLAQLDMLEGVPYLYSRKTIDTPFGKCWVYYMDEERLMGFPRIDNGDWRNYAI